VRTRAGVQPERPIPVGGSRTLESRSSAVLVAVPCDAGAAKPLCDTPDGHDGWLDRAMEACVKVMGGEDPAAAYAAAMLWSRG
jgi:hypothetical protein